jgi:hypothetical protein
MYAIIKVIKLCGEDAFIHIPRYKLAYPEEFEKGIKEINKLIATQ